MPSFAALLSAASSSLFLLLLLPAAAAQVSTAPFSPAVASSSSSSSSSLGAPAAQQTCVSGAHIIVARASNEKPGEGIIGAVAQQVTGLIPGSDSVPVVYPATLDNYFNSEPAGVVAMKQLVQQYGDLCPEGKMVLMGYSQGAQVVGDTLIGLDDTGFPLNATLNKPLATKYLDQIAAIIMMGDPAHLPNQSYDVGNSTKAGYFPRENAALFTSLNLAPKMQSYCDHNDTFCDSGSSILVHISYVGEYGDAAAKFVQDKFNAASSSSSSSSGNGNESMANATATGSASGASMTSGGGASTTAGASSTPPASSPSTGAAAAGPRAAFVADGAVRAALAVGGAVLVAAAAFA